jgi:hypothetical protein
MIIRRSILATVLIVVAGVVAGAAVGADDAVTTAHARQHSVNQSGAQGRISFTQTGAGVLVTGTATGLQPSVGRYASLVYDLGSVPGGPTACEPTFDLPGMFVGIWAVGPTGDGTLIQLAPPFAIAPLEAIDTVSIRDTTINGGFGPEAVVACGEIAVDGGR